MIVRILGEGQFEVPDAKLDALNELDERLVSAVERGDEGAFEQALGSLLESVRSEGSSCSDEFIGESDFVLPDSESTLEFVAGLLAHDGLVPG